MHACHRQTNGRTKTRRDRFDNRLPAKTSGHIKFTPLSHQIDVYLPRKNARFFIFFRLATAVVDVLVIPADSLATLSDDFGEQRCPQKALSFSGMSLRI